jgi:peroxiredoxin Q/BCP
VIGISADSQETADRFARSLELPYPLLGDPAGEVLKAYQVRWPLIGLARRATYLIGRDRRIQAAFWSERDPESHVGQACAIATAGE